ncbi:putative nucleotidyltransferase DUF294 [Solirubrobacter pauli]|uniref:Putative nucleotidyltransferase DUF294 n=1 Tax=Solirubrobacter pauli TaxID=166793 RepID=A0A660LBZ1_9ACTN|nr:DUF294 nucleotidyltransferase-like domain-containing protein [Solirubrobacter pauli]RKQ92587.1 putative nucleotidyltransferase DUF294 [Solirubrobacter pauli]
MLQDLAAGEALAELQRRTGAQFPNLTAARERTAAALEERGRAVARIGLPDPSALCLMGSWGRHEVVGGSDDDWLLLVEDEAVDVAVLAEVSRALSAQPGVEGVFGKAASARHLIDRIGLDRDDNKNLTRRILLLLESQPLNGQAFYDRVRGELIGGYVNEWVGDRTVPRFFLNDVVRYWRTICVDFAGKERERGGSGWGLRNAKLRNSRKILFASGLLPLLLCERFGRADMARFLAEQFSVPATSRIAYAFLVAGAADSGARALGAYDQFLGILGDESCRDHLAGLRREDAKRSAVFMDARRSGETLQDALLALLFETPQFTQVARAYSVF